MTTTKRTPEFDPERWKEGLKTYPVLVNGEYLVAFQSHSLQRLVNALSNFSSQRGLPEGFLRFKGEHKRRDPSPEEVEGLPFMGIAVGVLDGGRNGEPTEMIVWNPEMLPEHIFTRKPVEVV